MHVPGNAPAADGADSLLFAHAVQPAPGAPPATTQPDPADQGTEDGWSRVACYPVVSNDEVERRGAALASIEGTLSSSSTVSLAQQRRDPRSLKSIVRRLRDIFTAP